MFRRVSVGIIGCLIIQCIIVSAVAQTARDPFQPPSSPATPAPGFIPQAQPSTYQLIGVVMTANQAVAIFRHRQDDQLKMLRAGERIGGRLIKRIRLDGVVYSKE